MKMDCQICTTRSYLNHKYKTHCCGHSFHPSCLYNRLRSKQSCPSCSEFIDIKEFLKQAFSDANQSYSLMGTEIASSIISQIANSCIDGSCNIRVLRNMIHSQNFEKELLFIQSVKKGNIEAVKIFLEYQVNVNHLDSSGRSALFYAIENRFSEICNLLLKVPTININARGKSVPSVLTIAIQTGNIAVLKTLLEKNMSEINLLDPQQDRTPLQHACVIENLPIFSLLLEKGADPSQLSSVNKNILEFLFSCKNLDFVSKAYEVLPKNDFKLAPSFAIFRSLVHLNKLKYFNDHLKDSEALISDFVNDSRESILSFACQKGKQQIINYLLDSYENIEMIIDNVDSNGKTALYYACETGNIEIVQVLLQKGADKNHQNTQDGTTALMIAIKNKKQEVALTLIDFKSNLSLQDKNGRNAIEYAIDSANRTLIEKILSQNINHVLIRRALLRICSIGDLNLLDLFIEKGIMSTCDFGMELFHKAANFEMIEKLCELEKRKRQVNNIILDEDEDDDILNF